MGACGLFSFLAGEPATAWQALAHASGGSVAVAAALWAATRNKRELSRRDGLGVVTFGWLAAGLAGAGPYYLAGAAATPAAAIFESISGMTTTGATVFSHLEELPRGLLLWRSLTQYMGGMGVLILVVAILPFAGAGGMQLYRAEMPGPAKDRIEPRVASTAKMLWGVYVLMTAVLLGILRGLGMEWFDALCHALTTMATGGFSTRTASIAAFDSAAIEATLVVFMLLAGINFSLHYRALRGDFTPWWKDGEVRAFLGLFAGAAAVGTLVLHHARGGGAGWAGAFREVSFSCASVMTTTGYTTGDFDRWPATLKTMLLLLMFLGGCAGSTAGGIKVGRIQALAKAVTREVRLFMQPQAVIPVRMGRKFLDDDILLSIMAFVALFLAVAAGGVLAMMPMVPDAQTAISAVVTCMGNVGPGFSTVGPATNFAAIPDAGKCLLTLLMLAGRLELYTVLAVFMPAFWRK